VSSAAQAVLAPDHMRTRTEHSVQMLQGEMSRLRLALPEGVELRAVAGGAIERWELDGRNILLRLRAPVTASVRFTVTTQSIGQGSFPWRPGVFEGAGHQDGRVQFRVPAGLQLRAADQVGLERMGGSGQQALSLAWSRLPARARLQVERIRPRVEATVAALALLERGVLTQHARVDYAIQDAGVRQFRLRLGQDADLLDVACPGLLNHELRDGVLLVRLRDTVSKKTSLTLTTQQLLERIDGVLIPRIEPLDVERQTCLVGVAVKGKVELRHARAVEADQVDVKLLPEWVRKGAPRLAYRVFDRPNALVAVEVRPLRPEVDVVVADACVLRDDGWERSLVWNGAVSRGEVFAVHATLPEGVRPASVWARQSSRSILNDWDFDEATRRLIVRFDQAQRKAFTLSARFTQPEGDLRGIPLDGIRRLTGALTVQPRPGVTLKATRQAHVEPKPASGDNLAFAFRQADWELDLAVTQLDPVISVHSVAVLGVRQGQVAADALVTFAIEKAPVNTLRLRLPEGAVNSSVQCDKAKSSERVGGEWVIQLERKLLGTVAVRVHYDHVIGADRIACGIVGTPQATRHEGFVAVARDSDRVELTARGQQEVDVADVPRPSGIDFDRPLITAFRHTGSGAVELGVTLLAQADVLQAKAIGAILETIVKADGQTLTELTCDIRNANRQFLQVDLPDDATLLAAYVGGRPVNVTTAPSGATMIPLLAAGRVTDVTEVACVYAQPGAPLGSGRTVALTSPPVDVLTEAFSWAVYLPKGYRAQDTDGNMSLLVRPPPEQELDPSLGMFADEGRGMQSAGNAAGTVARAAGRWLARYGGRLLMGVAVGAAFAACALFVKRKLLPWIRHRRSRRRPRRRKRSRRDLVVALIGLLIIAGLAGMLLPALSSARQEARRICTMNNLNLIAKGFATYLNEHGDNRFYPPSVENLKGGFIPDPSVFRDATTGEPFVFLYEGTALRDDYPPNQPMGYMRGTDGVSVLFFDSHVEFHPYGSGDLKRILPKHRLRPPDPSRAKGQFAALDDEMNQARSVSGWDTDGRIHHETGTFYKSEALEATLPQAKTTDGREARKIIERYSTEYEGKLREKHT
ncbi:hypothetical protein HQ560_01080, partial [bacterium]|nr:hypothetical protein [bacterium]